MAALLSARACSPRGKAAGASSAVLLYLLSATSDPMDCLHFTPVPENVCSASVLVLNLEATTDILVYPILFFFFFAEAGIILQDFRITRVTKKSLCNSFILSPHWWLCHPKEQDGLCSITPVPSSADSASVCSCTSHPLPGVPGPQKHSPLQSCPEAQITRTLLPGHLDGQVPYPEHLSFPLMGTLSHCPFIPP